MPEGGGIISAYAVWHIKAVYALNPIFSAVGQGLLENIAPAEPCGPARNLTPAPFFARCFQRMKGANGCSEAGNKGSHLAGQAKTGVLPFLPAWRMDACNGTKRISIRLFTALAMRCNISSECPS